MRRADATGRLSEAGVLLLGLVLWRLCAEEAGGLPPLLPWEFSWPEFLGLALPVLWFARGLRHVPVSAGRCALFLTGMALIYAVLQTRFDYLAQHLFAATALQHVVTHDVGPFLVALARPGAAVRAGAPSVVQRACNASLARGALALARRPVLAGIVFAGLVLLWITPAIAFRAMLDPTLYAVMNASMVLDGMLFWCLVLDPRPSPAALPRLGQATLAMTVMFPVIAAGTLIDGAQRELYPIYDLCGRALPGLPPLADQQIGGLLIWILPGLLTGFALLLLATRMFAEQDAEERSRAARARSLPAWQEWAR